MSADLLNRKGASDRYANNSVRNSRSYRHPYAGEPTETKSWGLFSAAGTLHTPHADANGLATHVAGVMGVKAWVTLNPCSNATMDPGLVKFSENLMKMGDAHLTVLLPGYEL